MKVAVIAGGTGGAALAAGFARVLLPDDVSVITNTADDDEFWGLLVCPDTDSVLYRLAGIFNESRGFGVRSDTFQTLRMLQRLGEPAWFQLGDRDIALHLVRDVLMRRGLTLTAAVAELCRRLDVRVAVLPMSDDAVRSRVICDDGEVPLQEWFVRRRQRPPFRGLRLAGMAAARPSPAAVRALRDADLVVIGPSNPIISIDPVLHLHGSHLEPERVMAVSPIVGGRSLKGPTVDMMVALGEEPTAAGVARHYQKLVRTFVVDHADRALAPGIAALGMTVHVLDTVMHDGAGEERLARDLLSAFAG